jgi:uncharacterized membrane protein YoaK (UPF0700 family)
LKFVSKKRGLMAEDRCLSSWLSCGLAFVGGYGDAASFILARTFTGHVTGNFVLSAISIAGRDWSAFFRQALAIALFLMGVVFSVILERLVVKKPSWSLLPAVMGLEIVLISLAYFAMTFHQGVSLKLFVVFMSFALGLQNGALRQARGITVHTTYVSGMLTNLLTTGAKRYLVRAAENSAPDLTIRLLWGIWFAFVSGAVMGAALIFHFQALGIFGTALVLLGMLIAYAILRSRHCKNGNYLL